MREIETKVDVGVKFIKVCQNIITRRIPRHANSSAADVHLTGNFLRQIPYGRERCLFIRVGL